MNGLDLEIGTIYILYTCDAWKSYASARFAGATTDREKLKAMIIAGLKAGRISYGGYEGKEAANLFLTDGRFDDNDFDLLDYGFVETVRNGYCEWGYGA